MDRQLEVMEIPVPSPPGAFLSEIRAQYCGITLNNLTDQIVANRPPVYTPDLEYYKFQFKNNSPSDPDFEHHISL